MLPCSSQGKTCCTPLLRSGNLLRHLFNMAKTSSYHVKTTPKHLVPPPPPPLQHVYNFFCPLFVAVKLHMPPIPFCSPPPPPLPVISDQSLNQLEMPIEAIYLFHTYFITFSDIVYFRSSELSLVLFSTKLGKVCQ